MAWSRTGTVSITSGQKTVTGAGTKFISEAMIGDGFRGPNGLVYEITNIATDTGLSIEPAYAGPTIAGGTYFLMPIEGYNKDTAAALRAASNQIAQIPSTKQDKHVNLTALSQPENVSTLVSLAAVSGAVETFPYFSGVRVMSTSPLTPKSRAFMALQDEPAMRFWLGLGTGATANLMASPLDTTPNIIQTYGAYGRSGPAMVSPANSNLNNLTISGRYAFPDGAVNLPVIAAYVEHHAHTVAGWCTQFLEAMGDNIVMHRTQSNGVWSPWRMLLDQATALNDPQNGGATAGIMSAAAVSGFNVTKYANGQLCFQGSLGTTASIGANVNADLSFTVPSGNISINFATPYITAVPTNSFDVYGPVVAYMSGLSTVRVLLRNGPVAQTFALQLLLWGRWK